MSDILLPPVMALKSTWLNSFLTYTADSHSEVAGFLRFNGQNVLSPLARFEVVMANTGTLDGLVHIRCSHNKKFLRRRREISLYISAEADEPNEDRSDWACTLFQPTLINGDPDRVQLLLLSWGVNAFPGGIGATHALAVLVGTVNQTWQTFEAIDLETLVILPRHIAFKGDNDRYLSVQVVNNRPVLRFNSPDDKGRDTAWFEVGTDGHGRAQIRSYSNRNFWRYDSSTNAIWADTSNTTALTQTSWFWPVKVANEGIALRSFGNKNYCGLFGSDNHLNAAYPTIAKESRLVIEELVLSRTISDADFDLANAVIYGETPVTMATTNASNNTSAENTVEFKFTYTESQSSTWSTSNSWMAGLTVSKSIRIPFIGGFGIEFSGEYSGSYEWGETITTENTLETTYSVVVPPNTSISVSLMATKGLCNIPFSYYQKDLLYNGRTAVFRKEDGLYTGANSFNFRYEVAETTLDASRADQQTKYWSQKIPLPAEAGKEQAQIRSSLENTTQKPNVNLLQMKEAQEVLPPPDLEEMLTQGSSDTGATLEQMLPNPLTDSSIDQKVPLPFPPNKAPISQQFSSSEETTQELNLPLSSEETTQDVAQTTQEIQKLSLSPAV